MLSALQRKIHGNALCPVCCIAKSTEMPLCAASYEAKDTEMLLCQACYIAKGSQSSFCAQHFTIHKKDTRDAFVPGVLQCKGREGQVTSSRPDSGLESRWGGGGGWVRFLT